MHHLNNKLNKQFKSLEEEPYHCGWDDQSRLIGRQEFNKVSCICESDTGKSVHIHKQIRR